MSLKHSLQKMRKVIGGFGSLFFFFLGWGGVVCLFCVGGEVHGAGSNLVYEALYTGEKKYRCN